MKNIKTVLTIVLIIMIPISTLLLAGCQAADTSEVTTRTTTETQFAVVRTEGLENSRVDCDTSVEVIVDRQTNVMYMKTTETTLRGVGTGLTVMLDVDGKPRIYEDQN